MSVPPRLSLGARAKLGQLPCPIAKADYLPFFRISLKQVVCVELETRPTDAMVGCSGAAGPAPDLRHQTPGRRIFFVKAVGLRIYYLYVCMRN